MKTHELKEYSVCVSIDKLLYAASDTVLFHLNTKDLSISNVQGQDQLLNDNFFFSIKIYKELDVINIFTIIDWVKDKVDFSKLSSIKISFSHYCQSKGYYFRNHFFIEPKLYPNYLIICTNAMDGISACNSPKVMIEESAHGNDLFTTLAVANSLKMEHLLERYEYDILYYTANGFTYEQIADMLSTSYHTINDYKKKLYKKADVSNVYQLIKYGTEKGFI